MVSAHERLNVQSACRLIHSEFDDLMLRCAGWKGHDPWISQYIKVATDYINGIMDILTIYILINSISIDIYRLYKYWPNGYIIQTIYIYINVSWMIMDNWIIIGMNIDGNFQQFTFEPSLQERGPVKSTKISNGQVLGPTLLVLSR